jgi:hypothetical protein
MFRDQQTGSHFRSRPSSRGAFSARRRRISVLEALEPRTLLTGSPTIFTVDLTSDAGTGSDNKGDLLYCVAQANANTNTAGSEIEFDPTVFNAAAPKTVTLANTLVLDETAGPEVIDGPGASVVTISGNNAVEAFSVEGDSTPTLSGLTVSKGDTNQGGGGIDNSGVLTVTNCAFSNNSTTAAGGGIENDGTLSITSSTFETNSAEFGGGIENEGTLSVAGSTIESNTATFGGGIDNDENGTLTLTSTTFSLNFATGRGGGIFNSGASPLTVTGSKFSNNSAQSGGGVFLEGDGADPPITMTVTDSTFTSDRATGTSASSGGGGFYNDGGTVSISGSTLSGNSATEGGGGIYASSGALTIMDSTVSGNSVTSSSGPGGGLYENGGTLNVTNSTFAGNSAGNVGAGIDENAGTLKAVNCTIAYNTEPSTGAGLGGGLNIDQGTATLDNTIVALNTDGTSASSPPDNLFLDGSGTVSPASANNLTGAGGGNSGLQSGINGNLVGVANPDLGALASNGGPTQTIALLVGSPAIHAGSATLDVDPEGSALATDQRGTGFPRKVNGFVDIGAFEVQVVTNNPAPILTTISPREIAVGFASPLTFTVTGSGFINSSVVDWGSTALATTDVSSTKLTATIPASDFATTGSFSVTVVNPAPGGGTSNASTFQVLAAPSVVFVNAAYASDPQGFPVTETGGITAFVGSNAFSTVQGGVTAVASGGTVELAAGIYVEQVTITHSLTLAATLGSDNTVDTTIQSPAGFLAGDDEVTIASGASVKLSDLFVEKPGGDNGLNSGTGIADDGGSLTGTDVPVFGYTAGVAVENAGAAKITDSQIFGDDFGIVVDSSSSGTSLVTANYDSFTNDNVGVLNLQTSASGSVDAMLNWWSSTSGPTSSTNPGGAGVAVSANVDFDPWLGDQNLDPYDYLVFSITAGDSYVVSPNSGNTELEVTAFGGTVVIGGHPITLQPLLLGTIPGGETDTLGFSGTGGTVTIDGELSADNDFLVKDTSVQFQTGDGLGGTTIAFNGTAITRNVDAEGAVNDFSIEGAGVSGPSGTLAGHSGKNLFFFDTKGNVLGNIQGAGSTTLDYSTDAEVGPLTNSDPQGVYVNLGAGTATGVSGSVSGITAIIGGPLNDILEAGTVPDVTLTGGPGNNSLSGNGAGDSVLESIGSNYTLTEGLLTGTGESFTDELGGIKVANLDATNPNSNSFNVSGWTGTGSLNGLPGISMVIASKNANFDLTDTSLTSSEGMSMSLSGISAANLTGTGSGDVFVTSGWTQGGALKGNNGVVEAAVSAKTTLTNTSLTSGTMALNLSGIKTAYLSVVPAAGQPVLMLNASAFSGVSNLGAAGAGNAILYSGSGADSSMSITGSGNDILIGNAPKMNLSDSGSGRNILIGAGSGGDTIAGNGNDILVSGRTDFDSISPVNFAALHGILAEWTSSASYPIRISKIKVGLGPFHRFAFRANTISADPKKNTLADGALALNAGDWFLASLKDHVTKKIHEVKTLI